MRPAAAASREAFEARLRAFRLPPAEIARLADEAGRSESGTTEVFAWLGTALGWMAACVTQWRRGPDGRLAGLDYAGAAAAAQLAGLDPAPEDFTWLRLLEAEMIAIAQEGRLRDGTTVH